MGGSTGLIIALFVMVGLLYGIVALVNALVRRVRKRKVDGETCPKCGRAMSDADREVVFAFRGRVAYACRRCNRAQQRSNKVMGYFAIILGISGILINIPMAVAAFQAAIRAHKHLPWGNLNEVILTTGSGLFFIHLGLAAIRADRTEIATSGDQMSRNS